MAGIKTGFKYPIRQAIRNEIRQVNRDGHITLSATEFMSTLKRIERTAQQVKANAYRAGTALSD